jgi:uncharacterized protein YukE
MPESFAGITVPDGEPGGLRAAARQFNALALQIDSCSGRVRSLPGQLADWRGPASARFAGAAQEHADAAGGAVSALSTAGHAAAHYAEALHDAQEDARRAIDDARDATDRIKTLERQIQEARDREAAANERAASAGIALDTAMATGMDDPIAASEYAAATQAATDARGDQIVLTRRLEDAKDDLERAQKRGEKAEKAAKIAGRAATAGFAALGDCVLYVSAPGAAATAAVGAGHVPPMYPPHRPGRGPMSDAASGDGYRTHGDPLRFYRQWAAEQEAKRQAAEAAKKKDDGGGLFGKIVHGGLDLAGMVPVIGEPADLANAGIYALEGDMANAALSGGAALPFVGMAATGAKWGKRAVDVADELHDASKALPSGGYPTNTYARPSGFRKPVRDTVWSDAREASTGQVRDPVTGQFMSPDKPWDMGHQPGYEFRKHAASAEERGITREQFLDEHNDPSHYRPELPHSNQTHAGEDHSDAYFGP